MPLAEGEGLMLDSTDNVYLHPMNGETIPHGRRTPISNGSWNWLPKSRRTAQRVFATSTGE